MFRPASAQAQQRRREVVVDGKRTRTVDVHAHCQVPEANALMGLKVQPQSLVVAPERIKAMDEQGIDIEALSINPIFWYKAEPRSPIRSSSCKMRNSLRFARRSPTGLSVWRRWPCSTPILLLFFTRRFESAGELLLRSLQENQSWVPTYRFLASCYAHLGRLDEARELVERLRTITPVLEPRASPWRSPAHRELYLSGLHMAAREVA